MGYKALYLICVLLCIACQSTDEGGSQNSTMRSEVDYSYYAGQEMNQAGTTAQIMELDDMFIQAGTQVADPVDLFIPTMMDQSFADLDVPARDMMVMDMMMDMEIPEDIPPADVDTDGDGLMDRWEWQTQDRSAFDWMLSDTDGDGIADGDEDEDADGLTASVEQWLDTYNVDHVDQVIEQQHFNPLVYDMLVELDQMQEASFAREALLLVIDAFKQIQGMNHLSNGIQVHFYIDETLDATLVPAQVEQRHRLLAQHPATRFTVDFPTHRLVHVVSATERDDRIYRAGEVVGHPEDVEQAGVFIYQTYIASIHPRCGLDDPVDPVAFITFIEAQAGTLIHELGHVLQLGHDTDVEGLNPWNVMSVLEGCVSSRQRFHGEGNDDMSLGSISMDAASRFSQAAVDLMRSDLLLSVDVSELLMEGQGIEH